MASMTFHVGTQVDSSGLEIDVSRYGSIVMQIESIGVMSATVTWQAMILGTWTDIRAQNLSTGAIATTATAVGLYLVPAGVYKMRAVISSWVSGAIKISGTGFREYVTLSGGSAAGDAARYDVVLNLDTNIYADDDVLSATQEIAGAFSYGSQIVLYDIRVLDEDDQGQAMDLLFLRSNTSIGAANAAYAPTNAMGREILKKVSILAGDYVDEGVWQSAYKSLADGIGCVLQPTTGTSLWLATVNRSGTPTHTANGIRVQFGVMQVG